MADGGDDGRVPLQYDGGIFVRDAGDADGRVIVYFVSETVYFMAGVFGMCAGGCVCAHVSAIEVSKVWKKL